MNKTLGQELEYFCVIGIQLMTRSDFYVDYGKFQLLTTWLFFIRIYRNDSALKNVRREQRFERNDGTRPSRVERLAYTLPTGNMNISDRSCSASDQYMAGAFSQNFGQQKRVITSGKRHISIFPRETSRRDVRGWGWVSGCDVATTFRVKIDMWRFPYTPGGAEVHFAEYTSHKGVAGNGLLPPSDTVWSYCVAVKLRLGRTGSFTVLQMTTGWYRESLSQYLLHLGRSTSFRQYTLILTPSPLSYPSERCLKVEEWRLGQTGSNSTIWCL